MAKTLRPTWVGRVKLVPRGTVWYLCYHEHGRRRRPRIGPDFVQAKQAAAQINAQLALQLPGLLSFEPLSIAELRERWLDYHEHVRRSSVATVRRYRTATSHLLAFLDARPVARLASEFGPRQAELFVQYLRTVRVAANGHPNSQKRRLLDHGVKFILETCCSLFTYAIKQRHMSPYAENPFQTLEVGRLPVEDVRPIVPLTADDEQHLLEHCDDWQFPLFLTLLWTGLRPGELIHLLFPEDLDLREGWLFIRNKPRLGWQVKTRTERAVPIAPPLVDVLRVMLGGRLRGPVFRQRRCATGFLPVLESATTSQLEQEFAARVQRYESKQALTRLKKLTIAQTVWRDVGALRVEFLRNEFIGLMERMGLSTTAPKTLRHTFATLLQDANVDPLIRNELMGHAPSAMPTFQGATSRGLGMTAIYTHTRPETKRRQLLDALACRPSWNYVVRRLKGLSEVDIPFPPDAEAS